MNRDHPKKKLAPKYLSFLESFNNMMNLSKNLDLPDARKMATQFFLKDVHLEPIEKVINKTIPGPDKNDISLRILVPKGKGPFPVLLFFHGGGWMFGSIDDVEPQCRRIANSAQCIVVIVEYRLAPEFKFPKGLEDCYAATTWASKHAQEFSGDPTKIAVGGESAGGNLAAAVTLMARDLKNLSIKFQLLIYPVTSVEINRKPFDDSLDKTFITFQVMKMFWEFYLPTPNDGKNPYASPLLAHDLQGLPPAFILVAEHDGLGYEGEKYAERLEEAGVKTKFKRYSDTFHGFLGLPVEEPISEAIQDIKAELQNIFK